MALVQFGGGVLDMRGSVGGQVFSRNRFGNYIRARTTPVNPRSEGQVRIRSIVAQNSQVWSSLLTAAQRAAWDVYASNIVTTNKLGEQVKLTGFNHFIRSAVFRRQSFVARVVDGPTVLSLAPQDPLMVATVDEANQELSVAFDDTMDWVDQDLGMMGIYMSTPQGVGTTFIRGPWRYAGVILGSSTTPPTTPTTIAVPFPVAEDQVVAVRARISEEDGRLSDLFRSQSTVTA